ncbi:hypothetical protein JCM10207_005453 [Rhodosporidiobolus poonsookiae]
MSDSSDFESSEPAPPPFRAPTKPLAPELWLLVFQQKVLKYGDCKRLERVCKDFKKLIESHSLDDRLFRSPPPALPVKRGTKYATSPASRGVTMDMGAGVVVVRAGGVRVCDVVEAVAKMWSSRPPSYICQEITEEYRSWWPEITPSSITWRHTLGDHCFWEGMQSATVADEDIVFLKPHWFGS